MKLMPTSTTLSVNKSRGFTLIELLIAVSIIAVLSAIGFITYSAVLKQGRDSKRQSDLRTIQSALEQYYRDQGFYPFSTGGSKGLDDKLSQVYPQAFTNVVGSALTIVTKTYLNSLLQDPINPTGTLRYRYGTIPSACDNNPTKCTNYCLYAKLENPPSPVPSPPTGCTYPPGYNFAVTPP